MHFTERTFKDKLGATVIQSRLLPATVRQGFEKTVLLPGIKVDLAGWQRSHSQGSGTGTESASAIRYAPAEVNRHYQNLGIERYLRELVTLKPDDIDLWLTTTTTTHLGTLRLKEIQYRVDAVRKEISRRIFEASIEVANERDNPRITVNATPYVKTF
jgi:hypothetical protein